MACYSLTILNYYDKVKTMSDLKTRLREPSSYAGLAAVFQGVGECLKGDYANGIPLIVLGLIGVFKAENTPK